MSNDSSKQLPPAASVPQECVVGPAENELLDPSSFIGWGHHHQGDRYQEVGDNFDDYPSKRRRHCNNNNNNNNNDTSFQKAINTFLSSGCCCFEKPVLPPQFVQACLDRAKSDYRFLEGLMKKERKRLLNRGEHDEGSMVSLMRQDYTEWVARDGGRVDIRYGLNRYPYNCGGLIYNSIVFPLVQALLNGSNDENDDSNNEPIQLLYAGIMWGMPAGDEQDDNNTSCHQKWHADGGHLFSPNQLPEGLTLPPHCINVFYPLVDLTEDNGPSEFRIASHRFDQDKNSNGKVVEFHLTCPAGGAVLFDYRIQHRGRANLLPKESKPVSSSNHESDTDIDRARPVLYLAYAKTFFKDHGNTRSGRRLVPQGTDSIWTARALEGRAVPLGKGFDNYSGLSSNSDNDQCNENHNNGDVKKRNANNDTSIENSEGTSSEAATAAASTAIANNSDSVGERWILFQMTLELPNDKSEILKVYKGDVAVEVAQQFCFKHGLQDDFVPVLAQTIQGQMDNCS